MHDRLAKLWETVDSRLAETWTAEELAKMAGCSTEHLRRLCHRYLGRAPMHQVTYLRMRRAAHLLIFAGVFERHPDLRLVRTEQPGEWWPYMEQELDSVHLANTRGGGPLAKQVPRSPSEYSVS